MLRRLWPPPGLRHPNFLRFCCMDALLEAENVFHGSYRLSFANALLAPVGWSAAEIGDLLSVIPTVCRLVRIGLYSVVERRGVAPIYTASFYLKASVAVLAMAVGRTAAPGLLPWLLLLSGCVVAAPLGMFALAISELVDEHRLHSIESGRGDDPSTMLVAGRYQSTHALFAKPCNSLGPMIAAFVLPSTGDAPHRHNGTLVEAEAAARGSFELLTYLPIVAACLQLAAFSSYDLQQVRVLEIQGKLRRFEAHQREP